MKAILINVSTNNETYFFRDVKPFSVLSKNVIPEIISRTLHGPLNVWSAASSTGQEAFSMLMSAQVSLDPLAFARITIFAETF